MDEAVKLAHICCSLRAVIGYLPREQRENCGDKAHLKYVWEQMRHLACADDLGRDAFLAIWGNAGCTGPVSYFHYKPCLYTENGFVQMQLTQ